MHTYMYIYHTFIKNFIVFSAVLGLRRCMQAFSVVSRGYSLVEVHELTAAASLVEHGSRALGLSSCARA